jgi:hypothetical protein
LFIIKKKKKDSTETREVVFSFSQARRVFYAKLFLYMMLGLFFHYLIERQGEREMAAVPKPHLVCVPLPLQTDIISMLNLAKLLHNKGFHITFVNRV